MGDMYGDQLLSIGDFAALSRLSVKALRHYDEVGLLAPVHVDPDSRYRSYSPKQIERATLIGDMRRMDVPLAVIREVLDGDGNRESAADAFAHWWAAQERWHERRQGIGTYITHRLLHQGETPMAITTRRVPERTLAILGKELFQPELEQFIMDGFTTLFDYGQRHGVLAAGSAVTTPDAPTYAIYHGPVTTDQSSLVEIAVLVTPDAVAEGAIEVRVEPEHDEAYVELAKREIEFPEILQAYDSVAAWVQAHGSMIESQPSREVYLTDVMAVADDDHVCDVAFPYVPQSH